MVLSIRLKQQFLFIFMAKLQALYFFSNVEDLSLLSVYIKFIMFEQNIANLIDREKRINLLINKKKSSSRAKKPLFPLIKIHHLNPLIRQLRQGAKFKKHFHESELLGTSQLYHPFATHQILLIAKRINPREHAQLTEPKPIIVTHEQEPLSVSKYKPSSSQTTNNQPHEKTEPRRCVFRNNKPYTYYIGYGNNEQLVRQIMKTRPWWKEAKKGEGIANLKWVPSIQNCDFKKMYSFHIKRIINHFQFHHEVTTKNGLIKNLQIYAETKKQELFSLTPITFVIDFDDENCQYNFKQFLQFFIKNQPKKQQMATCASTNTIVNRGQNTVNNFVQNFVGYMSWQNSEIIKKQNPLSKPTLYPCYTKDNNYIWLVKPTGLNRGRGIEIFNSLEGLEKIMIEYLNLVGRKKIKEKCQPEHKHSNSLSNPEEEKQEVITCVAQDNKDIQKGPETYTLKQCSFVFQKYIQQPLLINQRKFDIRVWALLRNDFSLFFFKQGYLRTSSQKYSLDISNYYIHLTNNAVQQYSKQYGSFESGNQLSFKQFSQYLIETNAPVSFETILEQMKILCYKSMKSVKSKINPYKRKHCFQIFGFDFILDYAYKVWLIEVNTNPCIEQSSPLLQQIIPRMLNDAFKLTIDEIFSRIDVEEQEEHTTCTFSVQGYADKQNMWESLGKLGPNSQYKK